MAVSNASQCFFPDAQASITDQPVTDSVVQGTCSPLFAQLKSEFEKNFAARGEVGASVCAIVDGDIVVDLYGGTLDTAPASAWQRNTITRVFSCTKGAVAFCLHLLADRGALDFNADVRKYWPEFQKHYQQTIPVWMLLNHQAGLPALRSPVTKNDLFDSATLASRLSTESLFWEPGTSLAYHALTFGVLANELVHRVTGLSVGEFFRREIAAPLDLDFWIGLPASEDRRVAKTLFPAASTPQKTLAADSIAALTKANLGAFLGSLDERETRAAEIPAGGGFGNARSLAAMYAPLSMEGSHAGRQFISPDAVARMAQTTAATGKDQTLGIPTAFSLGFAKSWGVGRMPPGCGYAIGSRAFGHPGMGGSIGFADPSARLAFAYTMNQMNSSPSLDERAQSLIDAAYNALGFSHRNTGAWTGPAR